MFRNVLVIAIVFVSLAISSCYAKDNYIELGSTDGLQKVIINAKIGAIYKSSSIDTLLLHEKMGEHKSHLSKYDSFLVKSNDTSRFVLVVEKRKTEPITEANKFDYVNVLYEFNSNSLLNCYHYDAGQHFDYWRARGSFVELERYEDKVFLLVYSNMYEFDFALSTYISFPYNEHGVYGDLKRYMNVKTKIDITDTELLDYFNL